MMVMDLVQFTVSHCSLHIIPHLIMYFFVCDTVKSMNNKSKQDMLVKGNKYLYIELTLSCQAYSPEWGNTSWEVVCFCSKDKM